jgi:hypothetical protein
MISGECWRPKAFLRTHLLRSIVRVSFSVGEIKSSSQFYFLVENPNMLREHVSPVLVQTQTSVEPVDQLKLKIRVIIRYALIGIGLGVTIFTVAVYLLRFKLEGNLP